MWIAALALFLMLSFYSWGVKRLHSLTGKKIPILDRFCTPGTCLPQAAGYFHLLVTNGWLLLACCKWLAWGMIFKNVHYTKPEKHEMVHYAQYT
jgi:hypothetical protein